MKADSPKIDKQALIHLLQTSYAIDVAQLTFVPKGEESYSYIATTGAGRKYFVKVHLASVSPALEACYQFVHHLRVSEGRMNEGFEWAIGPYVTSEGKCLVSLGNSAVALFDHVTGVTRAPIDLSGDQVEQLAALVVNLHHSVASTLASGLPQETYGIPFKAWLMEVLEAVDQPLRVNNARSQVAHDLIRNEKPQILALLTHVEGIADALQATGQELELVVTHGDLASHNLIQDERGKLSLIDWGKLRIAPAARDLVSLWEEGNSLLVSAYFRAAGDSSTLSNTLSNEVVAYYLYHNLLATIADYGSWLILEDASQEEADNAWNRLQQVLPIDLERVRTKVEAISAIAIDAHTRLRDNEDET